MELLGRGEDAILRGYVGYGVADDLADFDAADLMYEQHGRGAASSTLKEVCGATVGQGLVRAYAEVGRV
jgi:hypothetical protein